MALKEKISKLSIVLDKSMGRGNYEIGEVEFNMADFLIGEYNMMSLQLNRCPMNEDFPFEPQDTIIYIGIKGTLNHGSLKRSMT